MKLEEIKDMLPQKPERMETVEEPKRQELTGACYDLIGCLHEVYKELGPGLPEYIYQGTDRRAQIERFHYSEGKLYVF